MMHGLTYGIISLLNWMQKGRLKWDEEFADRTYSPAKKGAQELERSNVAREQKLWRQLTERA